MGNCASITAGYATGENTNDRRTCAAWSFATGANGTFGNDKCIEFLKYYYNTYSFILNIILLSQFITVQILI